MSSNVDEIRMRGSEAAFEEFGETPRVAPQGITYSKNQVLGDWFPDAA